MLMHSRFFITGGTGTLGSAVVRHICNQYTPQKLIIYSRNEYTQFRMAQELAHYPFIEFIIGDMRDEKRLEVSCQNVDYIIHTAALKHVNICEENPYEAVLTNIQGAKNLVDIAKKNKVKKVLFVSTDKANNPNCLYGSTKFVSDKICLQSNKNTETIFSVIRFGNIFGSSGSVIEKFRNLSKTSNQFSVTDPRLLGL